MAVKIKKTLQKEYGLCGPASLEMLFSYYNISLSQYAIAEAAGIADSIHEGVRIDQLQAAVKKLASEYTLLAKYDSTIADLEYLTNSLEIPVGIEWQGEFRENSKIFEEGHYSVVVSIDRSLDSISIVDPEPKSTILDNHLPIAKFISRWWEVNDVPLSIQSAETETIRNNGLLFVLIETSHATRFIKHSMQIPSLALIRQFRRTE